MAISGTSDLGIQRQKKKITVLHKNKELSSVTILSKPNIESEQIHAVSRTKSQVSTKS